MVLLLMVQISPLRHHPSLRGGVADEAIYSSPARLPRQSLHSFLAMTVPLRGTRRRSKPDSTLIHQEFNLASRQGIVIDPGIIDLILRSGRISTSRNQSALKYSQSTRSFLVLI